MDHTRQRHHAFHMRCFLCDHDIPESHGTAYPLPVVSLFEPELDHFYVDVGKAANIPKMMTRSSEHVVGVLGDRLRPFWRYHLSDKPANAPGQDLKTLGCGYCYPENDVFLSHLDCWKVAQRSGGCRGRLFWFAFQTTPVAPRITDDPYFPRLTFNLADIVNKETSLGNLITNGAHRLPEELHVKIMDEIQHGTTSFHRHENMTDDQYQTLVDSPGSLFSRLTKVQLHSMPAIVPGVEFGQALPEVPGKDDDQIHTLYIRTVSMFNQSYIQEVGFNNTDSGLVRIAVRSPDIRGMRFALGRFGLRGLRILYADGSASDWLGATSDCWFGNIRGRNIRDLGVRAHHARIVAITLEHPELQVPDGIPADDPRTWGALLDREIETPHAEHLAFRIMLDGRTPLFSTPYYPLEEWRFTRCLPLVFGNTYTSGLTVFWSKKSIVGLAAYGPNGRRESVGLCTGVATHFPLSPGEYFTFLWIRMGHAQPPMASPFLLTLGTSAGRSAHFGPQILLRPWLSDGMLRHRWEPVSVWDGPTKITGILIEALGEWHPGGHRSFGVVQEPLASSNDPNAMLRPTLPEFDVLSTGPGDHFDFRESFFSMASLCDVVGIQTRMMGDRVVGMRIVHGDGGSEYLGSWDPVDMPSIRTIYDVSRQASLRKIIFRFALQGNHMIIREVLAEDLLGSQLEDGQGTQSEVNDFSASKNNPTAQDDDVEMTPGQEESLVEIPCGEPQRMMAWYFDEESTEVWAVIPRDDTPIGLDHRMDKLCALVW